MEIKTSPNNLHEIIEQIIKNKEPNEIVRIVDSDNNLIGYIN